jgi:AcrR family transcriptional regulator
MMSKSVMTDRGRNVTPMAARTEGRQARRRERTRARLIAAARVLFARQGVDNTRINEITEEADVGFGSFYNYFESKEAIVAAVLEEAITTHGESVAELTADLEDPAEVISVAHRFFVDLARRDPALGWLLVRLDASNDVIRAALGPFATRDLRRGIDAGRLRVSDEQVALFASGGALLAVMRGVLNDDLPDDADVHHAEAVLRMLGLNAGDAAEVARRPVPKIRS